MMPQINLQCDIIVTMSHYKAWKFDANGVPYDCVTNTVFTVYIYIISFGVQHAKQANQYALKVFLVRVK